MALETSVPRAASSLGVVSHVTVAEVKAALDSGEEFAFFDLRDEVPYAAGHILYAAHLPLSRIELQVRTLVPLLGTKVVLTDAGDGEAEQAARILLSAGYTDVRLLIGGNKAWADAGYTLFTGRNVPSIGFFEVVEHELGTPNISAINLKKRLDRGDDIRILDTRPREEFEAFHIPGAINAPGAEILHRLGTLDLKPDTLLVANCAGRTRSILGAQSLINAGVPNPVASLTGGTMEWLIAGYDLERGPGRTAPLPSGDALARARKLAEALGAKAGVRTIDAAALGRFESDHTRSLFRFDVRTPEEYVAGHRPGFRSAPGGQLSSGLERFVGVKGARIVLHDPAGVRDLLTASWLVQFGRNEVYVLRDSASVEIETGPEPKRVVRLATRAPSILASELKALVDAGEAHVVDLAGANAFRKAHIPGAAYAERSELAALVAAAQGKAAIVTSEDGILADVASAALSPGQRGNLRVLLGGNAEWRARGYPTESGGLDLEAGGDIPDRYGLPEARRNELFRRYLDWEVSLVDSLGADPDVRFAIRSFASH